MAALPTDQESLQQTGRRRQQGGWITAPFILGSLLGLCLAQGGSQANFLVYLIKKFNIGSIDAAQISNIINGCTSISPVVGAILSDAFFGCYPVAAFATFASLISMILYTLSSTLPSLRPNPCTPGMMHCEKPTAAQLAILYAAVVLVAVGTGGTRYVVASMGANQLDKPQERDVFFNWYFIVLYSTSVVASTVIVYVQDSVSWGLGFGICVVANAVSLPVLLLGSRYYRRGKVKGSPYTGLARTVVAVLRKRNVTVAPEGVKYYCGEPAAEETEKALPAAAPSNSFRCLNVAALVTDGDIKADGSIARPWRLCSVEQVEDLKALLRIVPLWSSSIVLSISIGVQASLAVLQALTMDRTLGRHFSIPAASYIVSSLAATAITLSLLDRCIYPIIQRLIGHTPTPLQRIGAGHVLNVSAMMASALVEKARAASVRAHIEQSHQPGWVVPVSALWLTLPFIIVGAAEALHFPGQVALYYQEFPSSLKGTATGMVATIVALGFYLSTALVDAVRKHTDWLHDNINEAKVEYVYWMVVVMCAINFGYYLLCASTYRYQMNIDDQAPKESATEDSSSTT